MEPVKHALGTSPGLIEKAIYTRDTRLNIYELDNTTLEPEFVRCVKEQAKSVACLILKNKFTKDSSTKTYRLIDSVAQSTLSEYINNSRGAELTDEAKFRNECKAGFGTAFLVGEREAWTAGHCVCSKAPGAETGTLDPNKWRESYLVFNFQMIDENHCKTTFEEKDIYEIKDATAHKYTENPNAPRWQVKHADWAQLVLDRKVEGIDPLPIDFSAVALNDELYMLGHPTGLPLKLATSASVKKADHKDFFEADLTSFAGNSGSPVLSRTTNKVVGVLFAGNQDFDIVPDYQGTGSSRYTPYQITPIQTAKNGYERCHRMNRIGLSVEIALKGRRQRKELSDRKLDLYIREKIEKESTTLSESMGLRVRLGMEILTTAINGKEIVRRGPNYMEYDKLLELKMIDRKAGLYPNKELTGFLFKISRNMCAYNIDFYTAQKLAILEKSFHRRFSPANILALLEFHKSFKWDRSDEKVDGRRHFVAKILARAKFDESFEWDVSDEKAEQILLAMHSYYLDKKKEGSWSLDENYFKDMANPKLRIEYVRDAIWHAMTENVKPDLDPEIRKIRQQDAYTVFTERNDITLRDAYLSTAVNNPD